jgi:hypothetical protein
MFINKSALVLVLAIAGWTTSSLLAEQPAGAPPAAPVSPSLPPAAAKPFAGPGANQPPMGFGPQSGLSPEENKILSQSRMELQKDPELVELNSQIKTLMEKRAKLTEEKLQKISPEAAAIVKKMKENQEKMQAERRAQMEAMQAKQKAQAEAKKAASVEKQQAAPADKKDRQEGIWRSLSRWRSDPLGQSSHRGWRG